jgi:hypothetical protein
MLTYLENASKPAEDQSLTDTKSHKLSLLQTGSFGISNNLYTFLSSAFTDHHHHHRRHQQLINSA